MINRLLYTIFVLYLLSPFILWLVLSIAFFGNSGSMLEILTSVVLAVGYYKFIWMKIRCKFIEVDQSCVK